MFTIISYFGLLLAVLIFAIVLFVGLSKIQLI
uniref:Cytochrome b6-f complex subunit 6 n=2 Tax=Roya TaxID=43942 RepID=A0A024B3S9_9VIRI|nr:subunit VI of cytochrome b6/f complex [Roya anglica]YP_009256869.1 subunit VI of cytochrome b6/f complex [Roya obtusa]AHZ11090.1 subunit VI of cytochrome b6/f complex [Roya anglica]ANI25941.1 subunit VI of cytochrome b6/f complex [Roya obtusa]